MITAVVVLPPVFWLIRLAGVVWSEAVQDQPLGAVSESPIVIVTVQVPVVPLANDPAVCYLSAGIIPGLSRYRASPAKY